MGSADGLEIQSGQMEDKEIMTWNPSVRQAPIIVTARPTPAIKAVRIKEMEGAAVAVIAMLLAKRTQKKPIVVGGRVKGIASSWVIQGRMEMSNRWFV